MTGEAQTLLASELLKQIFTELEQTAINIAVNAKITDDETRAASLAEVRAIRSVQRKLEALVRAKANPTPDGVA